jgi:hypothetical protein
LHAAAAHIASPRRVSEQSSAPLADR